MQNQTQLHNDATLCPIIGYLPMVLLIIAAFASSQIVAASTNVSQTQYTAQKMLHILDYVAVDYGNVIQNGVVVNQSEYREQVANCLARKCRTIASGRPTAAVGR